MRVVYFDWGGTLARTWVSEGREPTEFWQLVARRHGTELDLTALRPALGETEKEFSGRIYGYLGRTEEYWRAFDGRVLERLGLGSEREAILADLHREFREVSRGELFPETLRVLQELRSRDFRLGVISNHNDALREILAYHRLLGLLDTVTYSQEAGAEKPDPRVFELALRRAGCQAANALHIGDSWSTDYLGARAAGLRAIWLNRRGVPPPSPCEWVRDLTGLLDLLRV